MKGVSYAGPVDLRESSVGVLVYCPAYDGYPRVAPHEIILEVLARNLTVHTLGVTAVR